MVDAFCAGFAVAPASADVASSSGASVADGPANAVGEGAGAASSAFGPDAPRQSDYAHTSAIATISSASANRYILR